MNLTFYVFIAVIAASLASFYRALGDRILLYFYGSGRKKLVDGVRRPLPFLEKWRLIFTEPSACPNCNSRISTSYLLPVVGWLLAKGHCEHCNSRISIWHCITEICFAVMAVIVFYKLQSAVATLLLLLFFGHLLVSMNTDWHRLTLDYENTFILAVLSVGFLYAHEGNVFFLERLYSALGVGGFFLAAFVLTRGRQPGFGDILLGFVLGFQHGFPWILVPLQVGAMGSLLHLWLVRRNFKQAAPLGFYMALGSMITSLIVLFVY